jgi:hypothetical protein
MLVIGCNVSPSIQLHGEINQQLAFHRARKPHRQKDEFAALWFRFMDAREPQEKQF